LSLDDKTLFWKKKMTKSNKKSHCCSTDKNSMHEHPSHHKELVKLKRAKGQIEGVIGMIEERRYCPDILIQVRAAKAALQSVEHSILKTHIESCVQDAAASKDHHSIEQKISELIKIMDRHI
jgi:DNA-binding FrmR family transcriptional regulator